ncbi:glycosyltransferase family 32 protein [Xanthomonas sp. NCPPB 2865]|uniref:glycosyltransferase family 32 protein n=1 Tax=Xanthomonas TaxID=338 RepID=UPI001CF82D6A|nr:glycosyltransferase [Xanthomonas sp. MWU16-30325]
MIPHVFHLTAPTKHLLWEERKIQARLQRLLPGWTCHVWDDADNSALMRRAFPEFADRYEAIRFGVMKADIARCAYMHSYGGFYFDTDYKLLRTLDADVLAQQCVLPIEEGAPGNEQFKIGNAVFGSEAGHPFWRAFIEHIFTTHAPEMLEDHRQIPMISGPRGLTRFYNAHAGEFAGIVFPARDAFHPDRTWFGLGHRGGTVAVGSHLCWASWRGKSPRRAVTNYLRRKLSAVPI